MNLTRRLVISGRVQGVGYRVSCAREADRLGLQGCVRNLADGRVEVVASGSEELVEALTEWCRQGPPAAVVSDVAVEDDPVGFSEVPVGPFQIEV